MFNEEVVKAIAAHGAWKMRLNDAISTGTSDVTAADVAPDNKCAFGKWLYGPEFPAAEKASPVYRDVVKLHAEFHKEAATVLRMALAGQKDQATAAMGIGSGYSRASSSLVKTLTTWRTSAAA
jgi:hypothetical protein